MTVFRAHPLGALTTVSGAPSPAASGTSITLNDATNFPDPATVGNYLCSIWPTGSTFTKSNGERVLVTAKAGSVYTITRAQDGSSARSVIVGDNFAAALGPLDLTDIEGDLNAHGNDHHTNRTRRIFIGADEFYSYTGSPTAGDRGGAANWYDKSWGWALDPASWEAVMSRNWIQIPQDWDLSAITVKIHWCAKDVAAGNVYFQILLASIADGDQIDAPGTEHNILLAVATSGVAEQLQISNMTAFTPNAPLLRLSIGRRGDNALDTYDGQDIWFFGVEISYSGDM